MPLNNLTTKGIISDFSFASNSNVSGTVDADGNENAELRIAGPQNIADRTFMCQVQSTAYPDSAASDVTAPINVYGMFLIQDLDLST